MDLLSRLFMFSKFTYVVIRNISEISNVVTKETSQILLQTLWYLRKPQINLVSL